MIIEEGVICIAGKVNIMSSDHVTTEEVSKVRRIDPHVGPCAGDYGSSVYLPRSHVTDLRRDVRVLLEPFRFARASL